MSRKQSQAAIYHQLSKEKKRWKGKVQPVEIKILSAPEGSRCDRIFLKPLSCGKPGYVQVEDTIFCKGCFRRFQGEKNGKSEIQHPAP